MFKDSMLTYLRGTRYNPLEYFSHLQKEDKQFVLNNILPTSLPAVREFKLPLKVIGDKGDEMLSPTTEDIKFAIMRLTHFKGGAKFQKTRGTDADFNVDWYNLVNALPNEIKYDASAFSILSTVENMPFKNRGTVVDLFDTYCKIFRQYGIFEMTPVIRGLRKTFELLSDYLTVKYSMNEFKPIDHDIKTLIKEIEVLEEIDDLDPSLFLKEDWIIYLIMMVLEFYSVKGKVKNKDVVWKSFPMACIRSHGNNDAELFVLFDRVFNEFTNENLGIIENDYLTIKKMEPYLFNSEIGKKDWDKDEWYKAYPLPFQIKYEETRCLTEALIAGAITDKINASLEPDDISFDIPEGLLCFYMVEFNQENPIQFEYMIPTPCYWIIYEDAPYKLFVIKSQPNKLYAVSSIKGVNWEDYDDSEYNKFVQSEQAYMNKEISILQFTKNADLKYIFKYE